MTLEQLYNGNGGHPFPGYRQARAAKIQEIADYIRDFLKEPEYAEAYAKEAFESAVEMSRIYGDDVYFEIRGSRTISGHPLPATV